MEMDSIPHMFWYWGEDTATDEEKRLFDRICEFGEYFEDMVFEEGTKSYELIKCKAKLPGSDEWVDDTVPLPDELTCFSYTFFHYSIQPLKKGYYGVFNTRSQTLTVSSEPTDSTILHEMIHMHEFVINELPMFYHDTLYWALYRDLKDKIPNLDDIISDHAHLLIGKSLYFTGGLHDVLFLLKSFDLDIKMKCPLGTVFSYDRDEELKGYSYIDEKDNE